MNPVTQQVIEFLSHPELPFGAEEDLLLLSDPQALRTQVAVLLDENPAVLGEQNSENLKQRLGEADWLFIAQNFLARVDLTANFFEADTQTQN